MGRLISDSGEALKDLCFDGKRSCFDSKTGVNQVPGIWTPPSKRSLCHLGLNPIGDAQTSAQDMSTHVHDQRARRATRQFRFVWNICH